MRFLGRPNSEAGYTLTEMLIVVAIIGLLAAVVTPAVVGQLGRARARAAVMQLETVATAIETYRSDVGGYPTNEAGLNALLEAPEGAQDWLGPYLRGRQTTKDPWGRALIYTYDERAGVFDLATLGADGRDGGEGVDQDQRISSGR